MNIHFIAIGGAVMHNLAIVLHRQGHRVTGSDDVINEPSRTNLEREGLLPAAIGFDAAYIHSNLDAVILGMHAKADNPELMRAQKLGLRIYSFPEYLYEVSKNKKRVVIAGSHGKTTITSMVMHVLNRCNQSFDYMVGARVKGFDTSVKLTTDAPLIVMEGDEYLASPIHRESKFMFYKPHIALISGVAWDHINVFPDYRGYVNQFSRFAQTVSPDGYITWFENDAELQKIFKDYPIARHSPYGALPHRIDNGVTIIEHEYASYPMMVFGLHNIQNMAGAMNVCFELGIGPDQFLSAMQSFEGAANRLQLLGASDGNFIYRDFAHAPSKVLATMSAVKEQFPGKHFVAVAELHTFSSLDKNFIAQYNGSLNTADRAAVFIDDSALAQKNMPPIESDFVRNNFGNSRLTILRNADELLTWLMQHNKPDTVTLLMSSGTFGGLNMNDVTAAMLQPHRS